MNSENGHGVKLPLLFEKFLENNQEPQNIEIVSKSVKFGEEKVFNITTESHTYMLGNGTVVHNCLCLPVSDKVEKYVETDIQKVHDSLKNAEFRFDKWIMCKEINQHKDLIQKLGSHYDNVSFVANGKILYIREDYKDPARAYLVALSDWYLKKYQSEETEYKKWPSFKSKHLSGLTRAGVLEFDGKNYCFTPEFIKLKEAANPDSQMVHDLLEARKYAVRWSVNGDPVHDSRNLFERPDYFTQAFIAYFHKPQELYAVNPRLWSWLKDNVGNIKI